MSVQWKRQSTQIRKTNWNFELLRKEQRAENLRMLHEHQVYLWPEDQVPSFQKECDRTEKDSVKVKKLPKFCMEQILCTELSRLGSSAWKGDNWENLWLKDEEEGYGFIHSSPPYPLEELGIIKWSLNYPSRAWDLRGNSLWKSYTLPSCVLDEVPQIRGEINKARSI